MILKMTSGKHWLKRSACTVAVVFCLALQAFAQTGGTANYFYDANGRLTSVLSPTGEAAIYSYDAAGNFTAITRVGATTVSILQFTPGSGAVGDPVTIYGTGFSATAGSNTVKFNGVTAAVSAATKTQLTVNVPTGATTGVISVTTPNGTTNSSNQFFVIAGAVYFNSRINFGESVDMPINATCPSGSSPSSAAVLTFDGAANQRVSIVAENMITQGVSCPIGLTPYATLKLISPAGAVLASEDLRDHADVAGSSPFAFFDPVTLPIAGTYSIEMDPRVGNLGATIRLYDVSPDITGNLSLDGTPFPISFASPGQNAKPMFTGAAGRRISLRALQSASTTIVSNLMILKPDNMNLTTSTVSSDRFIEPIILPAGGSYSVLLDPLYNKTRATTLYAYDVPADITGSITIGGAIVTVNLVTPGQNANLSFNVPSAQTLTITILINTIADQVTAPSTITNTTISIINSSDTTVYSSNFSVQSGTLAVPSLPAGNYTLRIDPATVSVGRMDVRLSTP